MLAAINSFQSHIVNRGLLVGGRHPHGAKNAAIDVKMGIIDRVVLFGSDLVRAGGGWVNGSFPQNGGNPQLTGTQTVLCTEGAHAGLGRLEGASVSGIVESGSKRR